MFLVHDRTKNHIRLESSMHGTLDFVHADIKGEVSLWLSVNGMYHTSVQIYTVEADLTKQAQCHVLIIITVNFSKHFVNNVHYQSFYFVSGFPGIIRSGTTFHLFGLGEI